MREWSTCLCFIIVVSQYEVLSTIDINLNELEYLAARLNPFECRRLIAALHYTSYDLPNSLAAAERNVDNEIPCIRHLIHWNGSPAEGKGQTHEILSHRLRQINRNDLADWLGKSTFSQLGKDLDRAVAKAFVEHVKEETEPSFPITLEPSSAYKEDSWLQIDIILLAILLGLLGTLITLICATILLRAEQRFRKTKYKKLDEKETDDENQNVQKKRDRMKYSTESSDEITDTIHVDSETEIDF
ncbi:uncharacterized protein LOC143147867 [Ptiloglossa arizonensis]|uniref:uncharacterized protein LOC143147867 n=1 Tax=Ptiloglossa arizonensis TaxID=3350558 RepID=UPI003FA06614